MIEIGKINGSVESELEISEIRYGKEIVKEKDDEGEVKFLKRRSILREIGLSV